MIAFSTFKTLILLCISQQMTPLDTDLEGRQFPKRPVCLCSDIDVSIDRFVRLLYMTWYLSSIIICFLFICFTSSSATLSNPTLFCISLWMRLMCVLRYRHHSKIYHVPLSLHTILISRNNALLWSLLYFLSITLNSMFCRIYWLFWEYAEPMLLTLLLSFLQW